MLSTNISRTQHKTPTQIERIAREKQRTHRNTVTKMWSTSDNFGTLLWPNQLSRVKINRLCLFQVRSAPLETFGQLKLHGKALTACQTVTKVLYNSLQMCKRYTCSDSRGENHGITNRVILIHFAVCIGEFGYHVSASSTAAATSNCANMTNFVTLSHNKVTMGENAVRKAQFPLLRKSAPFLFTCSCSSCTLTSFASSSQISPKRLVLKQRAFRPCSKCYFFSI